MFTLTSLIQQTNYYKAFKFYDNTCLILANCTKHIKNNDRLFFVCFNISLFIRT